MCARAIVHDLLAWVIQTPLRVLDWTGYITRGIIFYQKCEYSVPRRVTCFVYTMLEAVQCDLFPVLKKEISSDTSETRWEVVFFFGSRAKWFSWWHHFLKTKTWRLRIALTEKITTKNFEKIIFSPKLWNINDNTQNSYLILKKQSTVENGKSSQQNERYCRNWTIVSETFACWEKEVSGFFASVRANKLAAIPGELESFLVCAIIIFPFLGLMSLKKIIRCRKALYQRLLHAFMHRFYRLPDQTHFLQLRFFPFSVRMDSVTLPIMFRKKGYFLCIRYSCINHQQVS